MKEKLLLVAETVKYLVLFLVSWLCWCFLTFQDSIETRITEVMVGDWPFLLIEPEKSFLSPWFSCQLQLHDSFGMILLTHYSARDGAPATSAGFRTTIKQAKVPACSPTLDFIVVLLCLWSQNYLYCFYTDFIFLFLYTIHWYILGVAEYFKHTNIK